MLTIKKKSNKQIKAASQERGPLTDNDVAKFGGNPSLSANTAPMDVGHLSAISTLRAAKKKPKLEADVSFGPTEVQGVKEAQAPRNEKYLERLKKRAK